MRELLEFFRLEDAVPLALLILIVRVVGSETAGDHPPVRRWAGGLSLAVFLLYAGLAVAEYGPTAASDYLTVAVQALFAMGLAHGLGLIALSVLRFAHVHLRPAKKPAGGTDAAEPDNDARKREREERAERERNDREVALLEQQRLRTCEEAEMASQRRRKQADDARAEAAAFYEAHAADLEHSLPPALFRSRLESRIPEGASPEAAWKSAHDVIGEMLPLVQQSREKQRAELEAERKAREATEKKPATLADLTAWYERQKALTEAAVPAGADRDVLLLALWNRYDHLLKETLKEMKP